MLNKLIQIAPLPMWVVLAFIVVMDGWVRVWPQSPDISVNRDSFEVLDLSRVQPKDQWSSELTYWATQRQNQLASDEVPAKPKFDVMSDELQQAQQGELAQLWAGEFSYRLVATFINEDNNFVALLKLGESGEEVVKLYRGNILGGYTLHSIGVSEAEIHSNDGRKISLMLFVPSK